MCWFMESGITESGESTALSVAPDKCWTCGPSVVLSQLSPTSCLPCTMSSRWSSSSLAPGSDESLKRQRNFTALQACLLCLKWVHKHDPLLASSFMASLPPHLVFFLLLSDPICVCWDIIPMKQRINTCGEYICRGDSTDICFSPQTEILTNTRQGAFYSLMLFHAQWMLTADLLMKSIKKSVQVFRSRGCVCTSQHTCTCHSPLS